MTLETPPLISIDAATDAVLAAVPALPAEEVPLLEALNRVLAEDIVSPEHVPPFENSAMDGFAVRGADLADGVREFIVTIELPAGRWSDVPIGGGQAAKIMTGAPLPPGADTVVQVEHTTSAGDIMTIVQPPAVGANVRHAGEDIERGDLLFKIGTLVRPAEIGLLASVGRERVRVARRPRAAILATGSELVGLGNAVGPGQIRNSNSFANYGQVVAAGGEPVLLGIARDDIDETRRLMNTALAEDIVITSGGVSVGEFDFVKQVQDELGVERRFWGVRTKPGKPVAFGVKGDTLVFGAPGNPVAAMVAFELYIRPALLKMQGATRIFRPFVWAKADEPVKKAKGRVEARRCRLVHSEAAWHFSTTGPQGSGILRSMALADGLVFIPSDYPGGGAGERFMVMLLEGTSADRPPFPS
jgi:molybdopterin molybdotransferase